MAIATGTALGIAAAAGAGASIFGAKKQSDAAQTASQQQQQAAQQAMAAQTPLYNQALQIAQQQAAQGQAGLAPYAQQGAAGLSALSAYLGVPTAKAAAPAAAAPAPAAAGPVPLSALSGSPQDQIRQMYASATGGRYTPSPADISQWGPNPDARYLAKIGPAIQQWAAQNPGSFAGGGSGGAGATVLLRAPSGQTQAVPADQVDHYVARGATRV